MASHVIGVALMHCRMVVSCIDPYNLSALLYSLHVLSHQAKEGASLCKERLRGRLKLSSPSVRVRVSFGGTRPRLRAIALDILGAVVPCPAPALSISPKSAEGAPEGAAERALAALGDGRLPAHSHRHRVRAYLQGAQTDTECGAECLQVFRMGRDVSGWTLSMQVVE